MLDRLTCPVFLIHPAPAQMMHPVHIHKPCADEHAAGFAHMQQKNLGQSLASYVPGLLCYYIEIISKPADTTENFQVSKKTAKSVSHCATCTFSFVHVINIVSYF